MDDVAKLAALEAEQTVPSLKVDWGYLVDVIEWHIKQSRRHDAECAARFIVESAFYKAIKGSKNG